jgi:hypothetical protein
LNLLFASAASAYAGNDRLSGIKQQGTEFGTNLFSHILCEHRYGCYSGRSSFPGILFGFPVLFFDFPQFFFEILKIEG